MAYENQIKCERCGKSIPDVHEDADKSALLCDLCYEEMNEADDLKDYGDK